MGFVNPWGGLGVVEGAIEEHREKHVSSSSREAGEGWGVVRSMGMDVTVSRVSPSGLPDTMFVGRPGTRLVAESAAEWWSLSPQLGGLCSQSGAFTSGRGRNGVV
jgi:hypothetical protein